jgi:hypothetical protein
MGMSQDDFGSQWRKLCEEHGAARDAYFREFARVKKAFDAVGKGTSGTNPTGAEASDFEETRHAWQDVIRRVGEFVKLHA